MPQKKKICKGLRDARALSDPIFMTTSVGLILIITMVILIKPSSRGGLGVERLLHKRHDSALVDQSPLRAWYGSRYY